MRRSVCGVAFMVLAMGACTPATEMVGSPANAGVASGPERIVLRAESNVCVSMHIDQRIWSVPLSPRADNDFSISFATALDRLHEEPGTSFLPGPRNLPRFVTQVDGGNPLCEREGQDIYVTVAYVPRDDGTPFRFTYRIEQGHAVISGAVERDIADEWRTGRLARVGDGPLEDAIVRDFPERARLIHSLIQPE